MCNSYIACVVPCHVQDTIPLLLVSFLLSSNIGVDDGTRAVMMMTCYTLYFCLLNRETIKRKRSSSQNGSSRKNCVIKTLELLLSVCKQRARRWRRSITNLTRLFR